jgi:hypothetical protein
MRTCTTGGKLYLCCPTHLPALTPSPRTQYSLSPSRVRRRAVSRRKKSRNRTRSDKGTPQHPSPRVESRAASCSHLWRKREGTITSLRLLRLKLKLKVQRFRARLRTKAAPHESRSHKKQTQTEHKRGAEITPKERERGEKRRRRRREEKRPQRNEVLTRWHLGEGANMGARLPARENPNQKLKACLRCRRVVVGEGARFSKKKKVKVSRGGISAKVQTRVHNF